VIRASRCRWRCGAAWVLGLLLAAVSSQAAENLLQNGGFETLEDDNPAGWQAFVQPQEGASAAVEGDAAKGKRCAALHIAEPYATEPYNNWSQNVLGEFGGKTLVLRGRIRCEDATDASLWIQCWQKQPWNLLNAATSASESPMSGTQDWTTVEVRIDVPAETEYLTVRCVLTGTGSAWFDELALEETTERAEAPAAKSSSKSGAAKAPKEPRKPVEPSPATGRKPAEPAAGSGITDPSVRELVNANRVLLEGYQALRETNEALAEQIRALQEEVKGLRQQLAEQSTEADKAEADEEPAPPLVPSGRSGKGKR
jgi:hypothetical protein